MIRRILNIAMIVLLPTALTACPDSGDSELEQDLEEGVEEVQDEVDDAL